MDNSLFSDSSTGKLVKRSGPAGEYWAFIPNSLPPKLELSYSLSSLLSEAAHSLGKLDGLSQLIPNPRLFAPFLRKEAVLSSKIEGLSLPFPKSMHSRQNNFICFLKIELPLLVMLGK